MSPDGSSLSASSMIALASETLSLNGYRVVRDMTEMTKLGDQALLAEDAYSVVSVVAFETWQQLEAEWTEAQADLVGLLGIGLAKSSNVIDASPMELTDSSPRFFPRKSTSPSDSMESRESWKSFAPSAS